MLEFRCSRHAKDGTPVVSDAEIADYAERLVQDYNACYLDRPWDLNASKFTEYYLKANLYYVDIYCEEDAYIAGATIFNQEPVLLFDKEKFCVQPEIFEENTILIDNGLVNQGKEAFERFTLLHEDGHFCIHRSVFRKRFGTGDMDVISLRQPGSVICCRKTDLHIRREKLITQEDFREHQANVFAAAIAMPKKCFTEIAIDAIRRMGCSEDYYVLPTLSEMDYDECAEALAAYMGQKFKVSKSAARVQLRKYKLIRTAQEDIKIRKYRLA